MSTASTIPETWELSGDDAREALRKEGRSRLLRDGFTRLRSADGFSHARSIAFLVSLLFIEGLIAVVGFASVLGTGGFSAAIVRVLQKAVPGPAGKVLTQAVSQAHQAGSSAKYVALLGGSVAALVTATTLLGQFERGLNRIYGIERDRPTLRKYGLAFVLALSAGLLAGLGFACIGLGRPVGSAFSDPVWRSIWNVARWPIGLLFIAGAFTLILKHSPRRHQPGFAWLASGAVLGVVLWVAVTLALDLFFAVSGTFGQTYGPLAGVVALMVWSYASSIVILYGAAVAAQLEAVRAGVPAPVAPDRVTVGGPQQDSVIRVGG